MDETLELGHEIRMPPEREICFDPLFETPETALLEPGGLGRSERLEGQVGERRPSPERESLAESLGGCRAVAGCPQPASVCVEPLETVDIELPLFQVQDVSVPAGLEAAVCAERLAELRDVALHDVPCGRGSVRAPELIDQAVTRHDRATVQDEHREQSPLALTAERHRFTVREDFERATDPHVHGASNVAHRSADLQVFQRRISV